MAADADTTIASLLASAENLPSMPAVAVEVLRLCEDEDATIGGLARVIERDPALSGKLLKMSNSPMFSMGNEVSTIDRATMVLGLKTVKLMSLGFSLVGALPSEDVQGFDLKAYWQRSVVSAVSSRMLAASLAPMVQDEAFLAGLLARIGQLVLAHSFSLKYQGVTAKCEGWPEPAVEAEVLGFHSGQLAAELLKSWSLPAVITEAVGNVVEPAALGPDVPEEVRQVTWIASLARHCEDLICSEDKASAVERLHLEAWERFNVECDAMDELLAKLGDHVSDMADMMSIELDGAVNVDEVLREAQQQLVQQTLGIALQARTVEQQAAELRQENEQLADKAHTDALTGLPNRAAFDEKLAKLVDRVRGGAGCAIGLIMIDVDHFKKFNDTYGHQAGDEVLKVVGGVLAKQVRDSDMAARYGGEEFSILLSEATSEGLHKAAERVRIAIEGMEVSFGGETLKVTASLGGALTREFGDGQDGSTLVAVADGYLYKAKEAGRNCCRHYPRSSIREQ